MFRTISHTQAMASALASDHRTVHGRLDVPHPGPALATLLGNPHWVA